MKLKLYNLQRIAKINKKNAIILAEFLARKAVKLSSEIEKMFISILFADNKIIKEYNKKCFGKDEPTDVITIKYSPLIHPETAESPDTEIIVNVESALKNKIKINSWNPSLELGLYIAHGFNHLAGFNDETPSERLKMHRRELRWLKEIRKKIKSINLFMKK